MAWRSFKVAKNGGVLATTRSRSCQPGRQAVAAGQANVLARHSNTGSGNGFKSRPHLYSEKHELINDINDCKRIFSVIHVPKMSHKDIQLHWQVAPPCCCPTQLIFYILAAGQLGQASEVHPPSCSWSCS